MPNDTPPNFSTTTNVGRARSQGVEFTSEADLWYNVTAFFNYTFTKTENLDTKNPLPRIPDHSFNIGLTWEPIPRLSLFTQAYIRSEQFENFGNVENPGWARVDVGGTYRLLDKWGWLQRTGPDGEDPEPPQLQLCRGPGLSRPRHQRARRPARPLLAR